MVGHAALLCSGVRRTYTREPSAASVSREVLMEGKPIPTELRNKDLQDQERAGEMDCGARVGEIVLKV